MFILLPLRNVLFNLNGRSPFFKLIIYKDYGPLLTHTQIYEDQTFQQNQELTYQSLLINYRTITEQLIGVHFRKAFVT
jgi:hypothetical protein